METKTVENVKVPLMVVIGRKEVDLKELAGMGPGSILERESNAGDPVEILAAGELVARGEVVVIDEKFGVRLTGLVAG